MPFIACSACQHQISDEAASCPNCGHPQKRPAPVTPKPQNQPAGAAGIIVGLVIVGVVVAIVMSQSGGSGSGGSSLFQDQYKVQMPNGDIKQMSESELVDYNKRAIKERDEQLQKLQTDLNQSVQKLKQSLNELSSPTATPWR
jgi:hypothetical protein